MNKLMNIFTINGCAPRKEWWLVHIGWYVIVFATGHLEIIIFGDKEEPSTFLTIFILVSMWPLIATRIRRWHDRGKSGWWSLINIIPIIGGLWCFIELALLPSVGLDPFGNRNEYRDYR